MRMVPACLICCCVICDLKHSYFIHFRVLSPTSLGSRSSLCTFRPLSSEEPVLSPKAIAAFPALCVPPQAAIGVVAQSRDRADQKVFILCSSLVFCSPADVSVFFSWLILVKIDRDVCKINFYFFVAMFCFKISYFNWY